MQIKVNKNKNYGPKLEKMHIFCKKKFLEKIKYCKIFC